ncbi:MAG: hypothetical protein KGV51_01000 [Moraxellaceae bacterium]|nr:hypothetical protein [Moraxellaceae bacterium]
MANLKMQEKLLQYQQELKEQSKQPEQQENQPEQEINEENLNDIDEINDTDDDSDENESEVDNQQPVNKQEKEQPDKDVDYKNKFNRVSKKVSKIEKEKARLAKEKAELEARLQAQSEQQAQPKDDQSHNDTDNNIDNLDDIDDMLQQEMGEDWEFLDDSTKAGLRAIAKRTARNASNTATIDKEVEKVLSKREQQKQLNQFNRDMDNFVKNIDPDSDFVEIINEPSFDEFLNSNRRAKAMFVEASNSLDDDSKGLIQEVVSAYLGKQDIQPTVSNKTPNVSTTSKPQPKKKKAISQKKIDWAYQNLKRPIHRKQALQIIAKARELGLD